MLFSLVPKLTRQLQLPPPQNPTAQQVWLVGICWRVVELVGRVRLCVCVSVCGVQYWVKWWHRLGTTPLWLVSSVG